MTTMLSEATATKAIADGVAKKGWQLYHFKIIKAICFYRWLFYFTYFFVQTMVVF